VFSPFEVVDILGGVRSEAIVVKEAGYAGLGVVGSRVEDMLFGGEEVKDVLTF